mmetsp:Transcript_56676/g.83177  ORF Transcript_56676/g.83177 Transcript_56676/m.83177 type:complete len:161 (+) Transcript_56676:579-1061(+)
MECEVATCIEGLLWIKKLTAVSRELDHVQAQVQASRKIKEKGERKVRGIGEAKVGGGESAGAGEKRRVGSREEKAEAGEGAGVRWGGEEMESPASSPLSRRSVGTKPKSLMRKNVSLKRNRSVTAYEEKEKMYAQEETLKVGTEDAPKISCFTCFAWRSP